MQAQAVNHVESISSMAASKAGATMKDRPKRAAAAGGSRSGCAIKLPNIARRMAELLMMTPTSGNTSA